MKNCEDLTYLLVRSWMETLISAKMKFSSINIKQKTNKAGMFPDEWFYSLVEGFIFIRWGIVPSGELYWNHYSPRAIKIKPNHCPLGP